MFYLAVGDKAMEMSLAVVILTFAVTYGLLYFLLSYGLYRMAKKKDLPNAGWAFIPFLRYALGGKIVGQGLFMGKPTDKIGVITAVSTFVTFLFSAAFILMEYYTVISAFFQNLTVVFSDVGFYVGVDIESVVPLEVFNQTENVFFYDGGLKVLSIVVEILYWIIDLANFLILWNFYSALFLRFKPNMVTVYTIVSTLTPLGGIFVFLLRNRDTLNVRFRNPNDFTGYGGPQNGGFDPYGRQTDNGEAKSGEFRGNEPEDPFSDF